MPNSTKTTAGAEYPTEPRTWTLRPATDGALCAWEHKDGLSGVEVIELEPILDLVERLYDPRDPNGDRLRAVKAFLREHGRLP